MDRVQEVGREIGEGFGVLGTRNVAHGFVLGKGLTGTSGLGNHREKEKPV